MICSLKRLILALNPSAFLQKNPEESKSIMILITDLHYIAWTATIFSFTRSFTKFLPQKYIVLQSLKHSRNQRKVKILNFKNFLSNLIQFCPLIFFLFENIPIFRLIVLFIESNYANFRSIGVLGFGGLISSGQKGHH